MLLCKWCDMCVKFVNVSIIEYGYIDIGGFDFNVCFVKGLVDCGVI